MLVANTEDRLNSSWIRIHQRKRSEKLGPRQGYRV
jgi:hypothetical protein